MEETSHWKVNIGRKGSTSHPLCKQWFTVYCTPRVLLAPQRGKLTSKVTRRAFLALRVIPKQRKLSWKRGVKKSGILVRKMEISQDLWIRLGPELFSGLGQVKTYPEMHSLVDFYFLREIPIAAKIFAWPTKWQKITKNQIFLKVFGIRQGGFRDSFKALWELLKPVGMISQDARQKLKNRSFWWGNMFGQVFSR